MSLVWSVEKHRTPHLLRDRVMSAGLVGRDLRLIKDSVKEALMGDFPKSTEYAKSLGNDVSGKI